MNPISTPRVAWHTLGLLLCLGGVILCIGPGGCQRSSPKPPKGASAPEVTITMVSGDEGSQTTLRQFRLTMEEAKQQPALRDHVLKEARQAKLPCHLTMSIGIPLQKVESLKTSGGVEAELAMKALIKIQSSFVIRSQGEGRCVLQGGGEILGNGFTLPDGTAPVELVDIVIASWLGEIESQGQHPTVTPAASQ